MMKQKRKTKKMKKIRQSEDQKTLSRLEMSVQTANLYRRLCFYIYSFNCFGTPQEEQSGVLLGECQKSGEEKCLFIKGVIKARHSGEDGRQDIYFDEKVWNGIYAMLRNIFRICRLWAGLLRFRMLQQNGCSICAVYIWIILRET